MGLALKGLNQCIGFKWYGCVMDIIQHQVSLWPISLKIYEVIIEVLWKFSFLINYEISQANQVTALQMSPQLSCGDMCKIVTWSDHYFSRIYTRFRLWAHILFIKQTTEILDLHGWFVRTPCRSMLVIYKSCACWIFQPSDHTLGSVAHCHLETAHWSHGLSGQQQIWPPTAGNRFWENYFSRLR